MSFNHYYQSELTALRQLGRRFAERSPALAPFLGQVGRDPDVERLLEGFAFLTGRLRQKLDDELPELSHSMMHLLWPNYMRPLPAFSILQFDPLTRPGGALRVERDTPVESRPVGEVACRFRTCYATEVLPLVLEALNYSVTGEGALLGLRLAMNCDGHLGELGLSRLRLHLAGERYISQMLYLCLLRNLESIQLIPLDAHGRPLDGVAGKPMSFFEMSRGLGYQAYVPFESFEHDPSFDVPEARPHYSVRQRTSLLHDGLDTYLSFGIRHPEQIETLSVELTCTNQNLPQRLRLGDICVACEGTPEFLGFRNITPATPSYAPPLNRDFLWKLISNMSLNYLSLANVDALKVILETYDLPRYYDQHAAKVSKRLLGGLKAVRHEHVDRLHRGLPLRGLRTELTIDPEGYIGEGDLFVFASVLNEFFALYASINSYHELRVRSTQGDVYQWKPRMGLQPLL